MRCSNQYHFNLWLNQPIVESTYDRINLQLHNPRLQSQRKSKSKVKESQTAPAIRQRVQAPQAPTGRGPTQVYTHQRAGSWAASCKLELGSCLT